MSRRSRPCLPALLLLLGCGPAMAQILPPETPPPQGFVTMTGRGIAAATPDVATVRLTVIGEGTSFRQAFEAGAGKAAAVVSALAAAGVPQSQVRSERFQAGPSRPAPESAGPSFQIRHTLIARVRGLSRLGEVLERATAAGATEATVPELGPAEEATALQEARAVAARDAQDKAKAYASALAIPLGRIVSVSEAPRPAPEPHADAGPGIDLSRPDIRVEVTVVWEIAPPPR